MAFVRPSRRDIQVALALFVLNVFDACATVMLLDRGAVELNPLMWLLLDIGTGWFLTIKITVVSILTLMLLFMSFDRRASRAIRAFTVVYSLVTLYHLINLGSLL